MSARRVAASSVRANKYATVCAVCGGHLPAGSGIVTLRAGKWVGTHPPVRWHGSPVSGKWVGGCPVAVA